MIFSRLDLTVGKIFTTMEWLMVFVKLAWGGKAEIQGEVLLGDSQLHLHQEDSVVVGEDLVYFSL